MSDRFTKGGCAPRDTVLIISLLDRFNGCGFDFWRGLIRWRALGEIDGIIAQTELRHAADDGFGETGGFVRKLRLNRNFGYLCLILPCG